MIRYLHNSLKILILSAGFVFCFIQNSWGQASLPLSRTTWDSGAPTGWTDGNGSSPAYTTSFACTGNNGGRLDVSGEYYLVYFSSAPDQLTYTLKISGSATSSCIVEESTDGSTWTTITNHTTLPTTCTTYNYTLISASRYVRWTYTKVAQNLTIDDVSITALSTSIILSSDDPATSDIDVLQGSFGEAYIFKLDGTSSGGNITDITFSATYDPSDVDEFQLLLWDYATSSSLSVVDQIFNPLGVNHTFAPINETIGVGDVVYYCIRAIIASDAPPGNTVQISAMNAGDFTLSSGTITGSGNNGGVITIIAPTLNTSPSSLSGLNYVFGSGPSAVQSFNLSGTNLDGTDVTLTASTNYEISTSNSPFTATSPITLTAYNGASTTIYVRLKSGLAINTYNSENISITGGGAISINETNSGSVTAASSACASDLIISEYVEGSGNNKFIEIANFTGASVNLSDYNLQLYANGSSTPTNNVNLSGTLADNSVIVYENSGETIGVSGVSNAACNFNGDDAVALYKVSTSSFVDIFGRIGEDPGTAWTSGSYTTLDKTLIRNSNVVSGIATNPGSGFPTLTTEWTQNNIDNVSNLGTHTMTCSSNTITTGTVATSPFNITCTTTASGTVDFTSSGTFTGNTYTAQLSDSSGSFASPTNIGTLVSDANSGTINITIPSALPSGSGYFIRVISNNPSVTGSSSSSFSISLTGTCSVFEIESILVDACDGGTGLEGVNEMVRFQVGSNSLNTADITVTWPNAGNPWRGICQNATTASTVAAINTTITGGGMLVEPTGGVLPANAQVMFFTSESFDYTLYDFTSLNYTIYAIFQCSGNTAGHFVNYSSTDPTWRTLIITFTGHGSDTVTYNAHNVYNGDGGAVDFTPAGVPTYGSTGGCYAPTVPLPITLLKFSGEYLNKKIQLFWQTSSELNNNYFEIMKSKDLLSFEKIGFINGTGNSNTTLSYNFIDENPYYGNNYYKLKQTDFDGRSSESNVITVNANNASTIDFYLDGKQLNISALNTTLESVEIYDIAGKQLSVLIVKSNEGNIKCLLTNISSGIYFVKIYGNSFIETRKVYIP